MINIYQLQLPLLYSGMFLVFHQILLTFCRQKKKIFKDEQCQINLPIHIISLIHAIIASYGSIDILIKNKGVSDLIYTHSDEIVKYINISIGYFLWDIYVCFYYNYDIFFKIHGICCTLLYIISLLPLSQFILSFCLIFEFSSIFLQLRNIFIIINYTKHKIFKFNNYLFGISFIICRIIIGIPVVILYAMIPTINALLSKEYNRFNIPLWVMYFNLLSGCILNILNIHWCKKIIKGKNKKNIKLNINLN
jgi:hypothetical protein